MFYNEEYFKRFTMMLTQEQQNKLFSASVLVFGVGGVGSALVHFLVRSGIQHIGLVDFDTIDITNINRQLVSNSLNVGKIKVDELEKQLKEKEAEISQLKSSKKSGLRKALSKVKKKLTK